MSDPLEVAAVYVSVRYIPSDITYFVRVVLRGLGGNLKLDQELARNKNIAIAQRYAHLADDDLDRGYHEIFND